MYKTFFLGLIAIAISSCAAYKFYQERIPNGGSVPHPCKPNYLWKGVGHLAAGGAGRRNSFGQAFAALGHVSLIWFSHCRLMKFFLLKTVWLRIIENVTNIITFYSVKFIRY